MSRNYSLAKVARQDIKDIWAYINQDNPLAAVLFKTYQEEQPKRRGLLFTPYVPTKPI